jgi:twitching motility protein PilT
LSLGLSHIISRKLIPRADGQGRVVVMEILNNVYGLANLIRQAKAEQIYTLLQTRTKDVPNERMTTMERSLATLVRKGVIAPLEAKNGPTTPARSWKRCSSRWWGQDER